MNIHQLCALAASYFKIPQSYKELLGCELILADYEVEQLVVLFDTKAYTSQISCQARMYVHLVYGQLLSNKIARCVCIVFQPSPVLQRGKLMFMHCCMFYHLISLENQNVLKQKLDVPASAEPCSRSVWATRRLHTPSGEPSSSLINS